jgi:hypothetical protein
MLTLRRALAIAPFAGILFACTEELPAPPDLSQVPLTPVEGTLHRLTQRQYANSVHDLLGEAIVVPDQLEPDDLSEGLAAVGASRVTISPIGVERYEKAALGISDQAMKSGALVRLAGCTPGNSDDCLRRFVSSFGPRVLRRPLVTGEEERMVQVGHAAAVALADPLQGLRYALASMLQSPSFLFRVEVGEPDPDHPGQRRYTAWEMATRLSYTLADTTPDEELREHAASGALLGELVLRDQVERLLLAKTSRRAVRRFFSELYGLDELDRLSKDPVVFPHMSEELGAALREETLRNIDRIVFEEDGDFRTFLTGRTTEVDRRLAALYGVRAPSLEGFARVELPERTQRRGFLGQGSFLALNAHPTSTSAVLRGRFIRTVLLCGVVPPPPANVNTGLPEPSEAARTLRERSAVHMQNPSCAGCHALMDPIGLGLENFDGIGRQRATEAGADIDPAGTLDGVSFSGPEGLAEAIANHPNFDRCLVRNLYRYAVGHVETAGEKPTIDALTAWYSEHGRRIRPILAAIAQSPAFRRASEPTP